MVDEAAQNVIDRSSTSGCAVGLPQNLIAAPRDSFMMPMARRYHSPSFVHYRLGEETTRSNSSVSQHTSPDGKYEAEFVDVSRV
jgi:hypothetical protein